MFDVKKARELLTQRIDAAVMADVVAKVGEHQTVAGEHAERRTGRMGIFCPIIITSKGTA